MSDFIGTVTNAGLAKIAAAIGGTALNLATIRVGDGNGAPITPTPTMTDLVRRVGNAYPIVSAGRDPVNANHWRISALIPVEDGPFDIREIGVWDAAGTMIAVARHVLVEKRTPAQGAAVELLTDIVFPVTETAQVTVQLQPDAAVSISQMLRAGFMVVESATLADPPGAPAIGRTHVVPAGASGAWNGLAGYLAQWNGTVWVAVDVPTGFVVVDQSKGRWSGHRWLERTAGGWEPGVSRLVQRQPGNYVVAVGTANALAIALDPQPAALADIIGMPIRIRCPNGPNTGPVAIDPNELGPVPLLYNTGHQLSAGDLPNNSTVEVIFDGDSFKVLGFLGSAVQRMAKVTTSVRFTAVGAGTFVVPAGVFAVRTTAWGAGGGGGFASNGGAPSGGASGGRAVRSWSVKPGDVISYNIGTGGAGGAASPAREGQPGGQTTVTVNGVTMTAGGGSGGLNGTVSLGIANAPAGGGHANADEGQIGASGLIGTIAGSANGIVGGYGAGAPLGGPSVPGGQGQPNNGSAPGGGGGASGSPGYAGGSGARGEIVIEY
ncbi:phage tail protein [Bosea sp. TWI1241]|uniref:phage tail-collar fiber domain-containing protein n=1 Tax=Bosea sp. TWI1241 TaxID=3148904 RepID=UPI003208589D